MNAAFELHEVRYRDILSIPELVIPDGSIYCVTGKSGSGKTTLLKLLNNMLTCDRGKVLCRGRDVLSMDPVALRRRVVMVPQSPSIFAATVMDNIGMAFYYAQKSMPSEAQIKVLLAELSLPLPPERNAASLSGGEKQRLALARALLLDPEVLLLDEPTAALDAETGEKVMRFLASKAEADGKTVVMVTHDRNIAEIYGDYTLILDRGEAAGLPERRRVHG